MNGMVSVAAEARSARPVLAAQPGKGEGGMSTKAIVPTALLLAVLGGAVAAEPAADAPSGAPALVPPAAPLVASPAGPGAMLPAAPAPDSPVPAVTGSPNNGLPRGSYV